MAEPIPVFLATIDALKLLFLTDHSVESPLPHVRSTAKLSTSEFSDYVERVKRWAATDLNIYIPDANEPPEVTP